MDKSKIYKMGEEVLVFKVEEEKERFVAFGKIVDLYLINDSEKNDYLVDLNSINDTKNIRYAIKGLQDIEESPAFYIQVAHKQRDLCSNYYAISLNDWIEVLSNQKRRNRQAIRDVIEYLNQQIEEYEKGTEIVIKKLEEEIKEEKQLHKKYEMGKMKYINVLDFFYNYGKIK